MSLYFSCGLFAICHQHVYLLIPFVKGNDIGENGRIVIDKGRNEIFFLHRLHYNNIYEVNQLFTGGECKVVRLNIVSYYAGDC